MMMNGTTTQPCRFCLDASCDPEGELTTENDYSSLPVGKVIRGYRMSIDVGCGKPLRIRIEHWNSHMQQNVLVGCYRPKFCPECGRKLVEQQHDG
jgi:hypothetical protein